MDGDPAKKNDPNKGSKCEPAFRRHQGEGSDEEAEFGNRGFAGRSELRDCEQDNSRSQIAECKDCPEFGGGEVHWVDTEN